MNSKKITYIVIGVLAVLVIGGLIFRSVSQKPGSNQEPPGSEPTATPKAVTTDAAATGGAATNREKKKGVEFADVDRHWAKDAIETWAANEVLTGDPSGNFRPGDPISRAEMATVISRVMNYQKQNNDPYPDLSAGSWFYDDMQKLATAGVLKGSNGNLLPRKNITREEAAVMLARAFSVPERNNSRTEFTDQADISSWALKLVNGMEWDGYIKGNSGYFLPKNNITRAEVVTILDNMISDFYYESGGYGGADFGESGSVLLNVPNVALTSAEVGKNLYVTEGVGEGAVDLKDITVGGSAYIQGGIALNLSGGTHLENAYIKSDRMVKAALKGSTIKNLTLVTAGQVELDAESSIDHMTVITPVQVLGNGGVKKVLIVRNVTENKFETWPVEVGLEPGASITIAGETITNESAETIWRQRP